MGKDLGKAKRDPIKDKSIEGNDIFGTPGSEPEQPEPEKKAKRKHGKDATVTSVNLDREIYEKLRLIAFLNKVSQTEIIEKALLEYFKRYGDLK